MFSTVVATLLIWWGSTALILYVATREHLARRAFWPATAIAVAALLGLLAARGSESIWSVWCSFSCGVLLWGWLEVAWLTGRITAPASMQRPCPEGAGEGERFLRGIATGLYHELAVLVLGSALLWLCRDAPNAVGAWTFLILWLMRWSAKLNLFLGVPNLNEEFFPAHLRFLASYVRRRSMNLLFPVSVCAASAGAALLLHDAWIAPVGPAQVASGALGVLLALGVLEHWFLVLPMRDAELWRWALSNSEEPVATLRAPAR